MNIKQAREAFPRRVFDVVRAIRHGHSRRLPLVKEDLVRICQTIARDSNTSGEIRIVDSARIAANEGNADRLEFGLRKWKEQHKK